MSDFDPKQNYEKTKAEIGYVDLKDATDETYKKIGFKSGLEVHQQLKTEKKLFCNCPAGVYHDDDDFNAEIIRHMRPTLSEMGEYDGTALMEFKTKKNIIYRINNQTTCTYEIDDTPPFPMNRQALEIALEISLLSKLNIVGEVHITRKQYLDGSIPTGFQRTAILGVEGEIPLKNKKVRLIQLSIEEDACREISDIGHTRIYKTDRLGMPLIETVTYPELYTPFELAEAAQVIRFLNRSTGKVRIGPGAAREDVNVSCKGGTRVEIKGVSHIKWIPALSHNEAFRQYALLHLKDYLLSKIKNYKNWSISYKEIDFKDFKFNFKPLQLAFEKGYKIVAINLPGFKGALSHFTQPGKTFVDEISDRVKVIACIEKPHLITTEDINPLYKKEDFETNWELVRKLLNGKEQDAQIILWGPSEDIPTALETIEERCKMAFEGVPQETRKSFEDGTTVFERVLPGPERMYPDTDLPPIPLDDDYIEKIQSRIKFSFEEILQKLDIWQIPENMRTYILRNNLVPVIDRIINLGYNPKFIASFFAQNLKNLEYKKKKHSNFNYDKIYALFKFLKEKNIEPELSKKMLPILYDNPNMEFDSILITIHFKRRSKEELLAPVKFLADKFRDTHKQADNNKMINWLMGELHGLAIGNIKLSELRKEIETLI